MFIRAGLSGVLLVCILAFTVSPSLAGAQSHDGGFFMRLSGGIGYATSSIDATASTVKFEINGAAGEQNLAFGAVVRPNLAVHGTVFGWEIPKPDAKRDGQSVGTLNRDAAMGAIGGGVTYYFMPLNLYVSPSVGVAWLVSEDSDDQETHTNAGFALDVSVGKEWWVSNRWGLGVAGGIGYYNIPDANIDESWSGVSFALRFSASFN